MGVLLSQQAPADVAERDNLRGGEADEGDRFDGVHAGVPFIIR